MDRKENIKTEMAFIMGEANRGKEMMVFDWNRAAMRITEEHPKSASAGLRDDWEWTGGEIYRDGKPIKNESTYLASTWATPELEMDGNIEPCYRMESEAPGWNSGTKWPESALNILKSNIIIDTGDK